MTNVEICLQLLVLESVTFTSTFEDIFGHITDPLQREEIDGLFKYVLLQKQLIANLQKEIDELKNPDLKKETKFFPMSSPARKRY